MAGGVMLTTLAILATVAAGPSAPAADAVWSVSFAGLPACAEEDSRDCAWDAGTAGNGLGESFYDLAGVAHYADGTTQSNQ